MWVNLGLNFHIALAQYKTRDTSVAEPGEAIGNWPTDQKQTNKQRKQIKTKRINNNNPSKKEEVRGSSNPHPREPHAH